MPAPSNTFNYAGIGMKDPSSDNDGSVKPSIFIKFEDWENGDEIEEEEDTGHIGGPTNIIAQDRSSAKAEPNFKDKLRFNEGLEMILYGLLGGDREGEAVPNLSGVYSFNWSNASTTDLPVFTLLQGFNQWTTPDSSRTSGFTQAVKPIILDNQLINEVELDLNADGDITISPSFSGDYPLFNIAPADPSLVYKKKSSNVKAAHITILMGDPDLTIDELTKSDCITSFNLTLSNNLEVGQCFGNDFGKNTVDKTNFTGDIEVTMEMNRQNLANKAKFATGDVNGTNITEESFIQQIVILIDGPSILELNDKNNLVPTSNNYELIIKLPTVNISEYTPSTSGDDAATVELKGTLLPDILGGEPINVTCKTNLENLPYGTSYS